jgi:prophage regulatory protein
VYLFLIFLSGVFMQHQNSTTTVLIRRKQVEALTSLSRSRIYALMADDQFPKPIRLGSMSVAWVMADIEAWITARISESKGA